MPDFFREWPQKVSYVIAALIVGALILPGLPRAGSFPLKRTVAAEMQLHLANGLLKRGEDLKAERALEGIIESFGDTPAGKQAQEALEKLRASHMPNPI